MRNVLRILVLGNRYQVIPGHDPTSVRIGSHAVGDSVPLEFARHLETDHTAYVAISTKAHSPCHILGDVILGGGDQDLRRPE